MLFVFYATAVVIIACAFGVVALRNVLHSAMCLLGVLIGIAFIYALLDAHFLAIAQVLVCVGAVMVLILFAIMLLDVKSEKRRSSENWLAGWAILALVGLISALVMTIERAGVVPDELEVVQGTARAVGAAVFGSYGLVFLGTGVLATAALITASHLGWPLKKGSFGMTKEDSTRGEGRDSE